MQEKEEKIFKLGENIEEVSTHRKFTAVINNKSIYSIVLTISIKLNCGFYGFSMPCHDSAVSLFEEEVQK